MQDFRLPIAIAVTGHRELQPEDIPRVEAQLRKFFEDLLRTYGHSRLLLLSPLKPGADRLAAKIAVEMEMVDLAVVLPWPDDIPDILLHRDGDSGEFEQLLSKAQHVIRLPLAEGVTAIELCLSPRLQQDCFADVGRYLARHSLGLAAIWNGLESNESQTWQVIRWHQEGIVDKLRRKEKPLEEPETRPVWWFPVGVSHLAGTGPTVVLLENTTRNFTEIACNFDRFNQDATSLGARLSLGQSTAKSYVFQEGEQRSLPSHLSFALERFAFVDQLSVFWQMIYRWLHLALFLTLFCIGGFFATYALFFPGSAELLIVAGFGFCLGWFLTWVIGRNDLYNRYLERRSLAEALRIHLFWKLGGLPDSAADFYQNSFHSLLDWIRSALRAWSIQSGEGNSHHVEFLSASKDTEFLKMVSSRWIKDQQLFFECSNARGRGRIHRLAGLSRGCLCISITCAIIQAARILVAYFEGRHIGDDSWTRALNMIIVTGIIISMLIVEYARATRLNAQTRSSDWLASLYGTARSRFDELMGKGDIQQARLVLRELGREALSENSVSVLSERTETMTIRGH